MKKAALTIGLFSLVMVTTSFTTPETFSSNLNKTLSTESIDPKSGTGQSTGGETKKHDLYTPNEQLTLTSRNLDFTNVNQSLGFNKKQD